MPRYKRTRDEAELDVQLEPEIPPEHQETLHKLRGMWEFASLMQYIYLFGPVVKIDDDFDIEDLETECLRTPSSDRLAQIGLQLLKYVSSHRGLTSEIFDEYTRRQFMAKAPQRNPFGEEENPAKFNDLDIYTRIRVLHQLSIWTLGNPDRLRGLMGAEEDQLMWRMEPLGWDKEDRSYFVLDDNRLYRRTDELPPPPSPKAKTKAKPKSKAKSRPSRQSSSRATRASKRRRIEESDDDIDDTGMTSDTAEVTEVAETNGETDADVEEDVGYGFTNKTWECVAVTLEEYQEFLSTIFRTRDPNERELRRRLEEEVIPVIEKRAESIRQKQLKKIRELENLQKMATAKRSSRLADKADREKQEREEREAEEQKRRDFKMAHEEQERQRKIEEGHESRRLTREQRLKDRETKRILHEEELARIEEEAARATSQDPGTEQVTEGSKRVSERNLKTQREQHQKELDKLAEEEEEWIFDCAVCGTHGENLDDGTHSVACERCNVWQHSKCHGFSPKQAESDGFHFVCSTCKRIEEEVKKPKTTPLKLKNNADTSGKPQPTENRPASANGPRPSGLPEHVQRQLDAVKPPSGQPDPDNLGVHASGIKTESQQFPTANGTHRYPAVANFAPRPAQSPQRRPSSSTLSPPQQFAVSVSPSQNMGYAQQRQHQEHHQHTHSQALASSGGHPSYQTQYRQPNASTYVTNPHYSHFQAPYQPSERQVDFHYQRPVERQQASPFTSSPPRPTQPMPIQNVTGNLRRPNGEAASPSKAHVTQNGQAHGPNEHAFSSHLPTPNLTQSLKTTLAPPHDRHHQQSSPSPIKSSSPPAPVQSYPQSYGQAPPQTPNFLQHSAPHIRPLSAGGHGVNPSVRLSSSHTSPPGANANHVATDGMSGPWPQSSSIIPKKHDQSPAPPASARSMNDVQIIPPVAPLMPSPQPQTVNGGSQSIPVKKMREVNHDLAGSPSANLSSPPSLPGSSPTVSKPAPGQPQASTPLLPRPQ